MEQAKVETDGQPVSLLLWPLTCAQKRGLDSWPKEERVEIFGTSKRQLELSPKHEGGVLKYEKVGGRNFKLVSLGQALVVTGRKETGENTADS